MTAAQQEEDRRQQVRRHDDCMQREAVARLQVKAEETKRREEEHLAAHNTFAVDHAKLHQDLSDAIGVIRHWKDEWSGAAKALALLLSVTTVVCAVLTWYNSQRTREIEQAIRSYSSIRHAQQQDNQWGSKVP